MKENLPDCKSIGRFFNYHKGLFMLTPKRWKNLYILETNQKQIIKLKIIISNYDT